MLTCEHIEQIINQCREVAKVGLENGIHATFPDLHIDVVTPPLDFLGANSNPAIFINKDTFKLLGSMHSNWIVNQTIALKDTLLTQQPIDIIGAIVHETGHAFNVAAQIDNSEANAYIFEIEVLLRLFRTNKLSKFDCTALDVRCYFNSRLPYYHAGAHHNAHLANKIEQLSSDFQIELKRISSEQKQQIYTCLSHNTSCTFFSAPKTKTSICPKPVLEYSAEQPSLQIFSMQSN